MVCTTLHGPIRGLGVINMHAKTVLTFLSRVVYTNPPLRTSRHPATNCSTLFGANTRACAILAVGPKKRSRYARHHYSSPQTKNVTMQLNSCLRPSLLFLRVRTSPICLLLPPPGWPEGVSCSSRTYNRNPEKDKSAAKTEAR